MFVNNYVDDVITAIPKLSLKFLHSSNKVREVVQPVIDVTVESELPVDVQAGNLLNGTS